MASPEPGFCKRRAAAVARLVVGGAADESSAAAGAGLAEQYGAAMQQPLLSSSSRGVSPAPGFGSSSSSRTPRLPLSHPHGRSSKSQLPVDAAVHAVYVGLLLMLVVAAGGAFAIRGRTLRAATQQLHEHYEVSVPGSASAQTSWMPDWFRLVLLWPQPATNSAICDVAPSQEKLNLHNEWMAATMTEHTQCKTALQRAETELQTARQSLQLRHAAEQHQQHHHHHQPAAAAGSAAAAAAAATLGKPPSGSIAADISAMRSVPWLQYELDAARKELQATRERLSTAETELNVLRTKRDELVKAATDATQHALSDAQHKLHQTEAQLAGVSSLQHKLQQAEADLSEAHLLLEGHDQAELQHMRAPAGAGHHADLVRCCLPMRAYAQARSDTGAACAPS
jgi:hypothetical protein